MKKVITENVKNDDSMDSLKNNNQHFNESNAIHARQKNENGLNNKSPTPPSSLKGVSGTESPILSKSQNSDFKSLSGQVFQSGPAATIQVEPVYEQFFRHFSFDETLSVTFYGRKTSPFKLAFFYLASLLSLGFVFLLSRWSCRFNTWATTIACPIAIATHILVVNSFDQRELVPVEIFSKSDSVLSLFSDVRDQEEVAPLGDDCEEVTSQASVHYPSNPILIKDYELRLIDYKCNRFVVNPLKGRLISTSDFRLIPLNTIEQALSGIRPPAMLQRQRLIFGSNLIEVSTKSIWQLLFDEVLHPFNVFQIGCITLWYFQEYLTYAYVLVTLTVLSCLTTLYETRSNIKKMQEMSRYICPVTVWREGKWLEGVNSDELIPGDLIRLDATMTVHHPDGTLTNQRLDVLPCDGIILNGDALMDESMLTGESIPVSKVSLDADLNEDFEQVCWGDLPTSNQGHKSSNVSRSLIFSGTRLIRARPRDGRPPIMMVHRTGFLTAKGNLVQSILFPRPNNFRFYRDLIVFISILASIAFCGFTVSVYNMIRLQSSVKYIVTRSLDLFTIVVPPAIHTVMSIGTIFAMRRLKERNQIYCISPPRINVASRIDLICFDKTGTLTEEGLDVKAVLPADSLLGAPGFKAQSKVVEEMIEVEAFPSLIELMSTCHAIQCVNGELIGDPLDLKMFEFTKWKLEEAVETSEGLAPTVVMPPPSTARFPTSKSFDIAIIRCFEFQPQLRRMSVIAQPISHPNLVSVLTKGSPESLREICRPESIPPDYNRILAEYAQQGFRVLACAGRQLNADSDTSILNWSQIQKLGRKQVESNLDFLGFIIFENKLKSETAPVIRTLHQANIATVMSTGDNVLTAVCVARSASLLPPSCKYVFVPRLLDSTSHLPTSIAWDCIDKDTLKLNPVTWDVEGLSQELYTMACTGEVMEHIFMACGDAYAHALLRRCVIFARMSPAQKQVLVEYYQKFGHTVGFCGDGANDCGALRAADVGVSLSQAEASVAAPFTSKISNITCCLSLIREGRASLATSFCLFKYMALYSMTQFTSLIFLYSFASALGNDQFTYIDLALVLPLGLLQTRFDTSERITTKPPTAKLFSFPILLSIMGQSLLQGIAQTTAYILTKRLPDYVPPTTVSDSPNIPCLENTSIFLASTFMYVTTAILFSQGRPYRRSFYWPFFTWCLFAIVANLYIFFMDWEWAFNRFEFVPISLSHKYNLLTISFGHAGAATLCEFLIFPVIVNSYNSLMGHRKIRTVTVKSGGALA